jgi:hypothetical protein
MGDFMKLMSSLFLFSGAGAAIYLNDAIFLGFMIPTIILAILAILLAEKKEDL